MEEARDERLKQSGVKYRDLNQTIKTFDDDDDIPAAPGVICDSVALVVDDDEATESDSHHQPSQEAQEPGPSRSVVDEFVIFESSCWPATG